MMNLPALILDLQYITSFEYLSNDELADLIRALMKYAKNNEEPTELSSASRAWFERIKLDVQRNLTAYEKRCRINSENGKKGGRPRKNQEIQKSEKSDCFFEKAKKANPNPNPNPNPNHNPNPNMEEEVNNNDEIDQGMRDADDLAPRGMVSLSPKAPPPPEELWEELKEKGVPIQYAEARMERAVYFARIERKRVADLLYEWWQNDKLGTPSNQPRRASASPPPPPTGHKSYDLEEFWEAALARSFDEI